MNRAPADPVAEADPGRWAALAPAPRSGPGRQLRELCRKVGALVGSHGLIGPGDRILAALSGGKDSFAMLEVLLALQRRAPVDFAVEAIVVDPGFPEFRPEAVAAFAAERGVRTFIVRSDILATMQDLGWQRAPCALCARLRRGVLYRVAPELGATALALGHHADDALETTLMNMFFNGQIRGLAPRWRPAEPAAPVVIRPLVTCFEAEVAAYARARGFRLVDSACPLCTVPETERLAMKHLLIELAAEHPRLRQSLLASLGNVAPDSLMDPSLQKDAAPAQAPATRVTRTRARRVSGAPEGPGPDPAPGTRPEARPSPEPGSDPRPDPGPDPEGEAT